eukprot:scaffold726_cov371-Pavlova_lutheri.AAC.1
MDPDLIGPCKSREARARPKVFRGWIPPRFPWRVLLPFDAHALNMPKVCLEQFLEAKIHRQVVGSPNATASSHLPNGSQVSTKNRSAKPGERKDGEIEHLHEKKHIESRRSWCHEAHVQPPGQNAQKRVNLVNSPSQPRRVHPEDKRSRTNQAQIRNLLVESPRKSPRTHASPKWRWGGYLVWAAEDSKGRKRLLDGGPGTTSPIHGRPMLSPKNGLVLATYGHTHPVASLTP